MTKATTTTATAGSGRACSTATTAAESRFSYDGIRGGHVRPPWVEVVDLTANSPNPSLPPLLLPLPTRLLTPPGTVHFILRVKELYIKETVKLIYRKGDFEGRRCIESILYFALFKFIVRMSIL
jgi:hypothetical protein